MHPVMIDGSSLTIEQVRRVAEDAAPVRLSPQARERVAACRAEVERIVNDGCSIYGVNTGFGALKSTKIPRDKLHQLQRNLIVSHSTGVGPYFPVAVVRAIMLLRANSLAGGYSGIRLQTLETLIEMLNRGVHPAVPEQGSVGASGDLAPISHLMLVLSRDPEDDRDEDSGRVIVEQRLDRDDQCVRTVSGRQAMQAAGLERVVLDAKEGLALNNGTNVMTAVAVLAIAQARRLFNAAVGIFGCSLEALRGVSDAYHPYIHTLRRHAGQSEVARRIVAGCKGSRLLDSRPGEVQDSYSLRCYPQVAGPILSTLQWAEETLQNECNAVTDNPLIFTEDAKTFRSGGNFHGEPVALACDYLKIAMCELAGISERRTFKLLSRHINNGLPSMLSTDPGLQSGLMIFQYTAAALVAENKVLAHPASVDSIPTSEDIEDHVSMGTIAARQFQQIVTNVRHVLAIEYICACQALDLRLRAECPGLKPEEVLGEGTLRLYNRLREAGVSFWEADRVAGTDIETAAALLLEDITA